MMELLKRIERNDIHFDEGKSLPGNQPGESAAKRLVPSHDAVIGQAFKEWEINIYRDMKNDALKGRFIAAKIKTYCTICQETKIQG
jgi:hypothetical protein